MFCSIVIPTIGRSALSRAVHSVLEQGFKSDDLQIIVVNDSGQPLPEAEWQRSQRVQIINTNRRERSVARNAGAAIAKGKYLCFLDDDDWLLPDALEQFWSLACQAGDAAWLYGGIQVVDETGNCLGEVNSGLNGNCLAQIMGGAWASIQSSFIQTRMFFTVGGFNPHICGTEDQDLCRRVALRGDFANTSATVACLFRGNSWNTSTDYLRAPQDTLCSRDTVLDAPGALARMLRSARTDSNRSYWYGRILRVYLSTVLFNVRHKRLMMAASRVLLALASFVMAGRHLFSPVFWQGAKAHHCSIARGGAPGRHGMASNCGS